MLIHQKNGKSILKEYSMTPLNAAPHNTISVLRGFFVISNFKDYFLRRTFRQLNYKTDGEDIFISYFRLDIHKQRKFNFDTHEKIRNVYKGSPL